MVLASSLLMLLATMTAATTPALGASPTPALSVTPALTETQWSALLIDHRFVEGERPTVSFRDDGKVVGNAGCEVYFGTWAVEGDTIRFADLRREVGQLSGPRPCSAFSLDQETRFLAALDAARVVQVQAQTRKLLLLDKDKTVRALLEYRESHPGGSPGMTDRVAELASPSLPSHSDAARSPLSGLSFVTITADVGRDFGRDRGLLVTSVDPLNALTLLEGDVILSVNGRQPGSIDHLQRIVSSYRPGDRLTLQIMRDHQPQTVEVMLTER
jgi:heat shock protein HslJ